MDDTKKKLNISSLLKKKRLREQKRRQIYNKIIEKSHLRIKSAALNEHTECDFIIPKIIMGFPLYNVEECEKFVIKKLTENGFKVEKFNHPEQNSLKISWSHHE